MKHTILTLLTLLLTGCAAVTPTTAPVPQLTPQIIYVTPAPTATPIPTRPPTAAPTLAQGTPWLDYLTHELSVMVEFSALLDEAGAARPAQYASVGSRGSALAQGEVAWLDSNPPQSCYSRAHAAQRAQWDAAWDMFRWMEFVGPVGLPDMIDATSAAIRIANDELDRVAC